MGALVLGALVLGISERTEVLSDRCRSEMPPPELSLRSLFLPGDHTRGFFPPPSLQHYPHIHSGRGSLWVLPIIHISESTGRSEPETVSWCSEHMVTTLEGLGGMGRAGPGREDGPKWA